MYDFWYFKKERQLRAKYPRVRAWMAACEQQPGMSEVFGPESALKKEFIPMIQQAFDADKFAGQRVPW